MGMKDNMDFKKIGIKIPEILLPKGDFETWATVACDQYTSQKEVWHEMERKVGSRPSTLKLILPEAYLDEDNVDERRAEIGRNMKKYLSDGVFSAPLETMVLLQRETTSGTRMGLVAAVDLDEYDYTAESRALIRSTEETIPDRLPPRVKIRMEAELELPHIMLLMDDKDQTVLEPLAGKVQKADKLYDFDLMTEGGHIKGYKVQGDAQEHAVQSLSALKEKNHGFLFAVGDGNHSLATAKECWEIEKSRGGSNKKAKYALVEIVNLHDDSLVFEPIHRVLYNCGKYAWEGFKQALNDVTGSGGDTPVKCVCEGIEYEFMIPGDRLAVAYIEEAVENYLMQNENAKVDYVHGDEVAKELGGEEGSISIILPPFDKNLLFKTVAECGQLPRKSFSMGHAQDKRYYLECRKIR